MAGKKKNGKNRRDATGCMREEKPEARAATAETVPTNGVTEAEEAAGWRSGEQFPFGI